jgi:agmatinase
MSNRLSIADTIRAGYNSFFRLGSAVVEKPHVALLGVPFDSGTSYRPGARFGPYGVRKASMLLGQVDSYGKPVFEELQVVDGGNLACSPFEIRIAHEQIFQQAEAYFSSGVKVFTVGGDHSVTLPLLRAASKTYGPLNVIHFDAHSDTSSAESWGSAVHHGTVFRNAIDANYLRRGRFLQVGLRGPFGEPEPHKSTRDFGGEVYEIEQMEAAYGRLSRLVGDWGNEPVYVSVDIDVVDPAFAPGTGTPVAGGLQPRELFKALRLLAGLNIIGFDVMEVAPDHDHGEITSLLAAHVLFEGLSALAGSRRLLNR